MMDSKAGTGHERIADAYDCFDNDCTFISDYEDTPRVESTQSPCRQYQSKQVSFAEYNQQQLQQQQTPRHIRQLQQRSNLTEALSGREQRPDETNVEYQRRVNS